MLNLLLNKSPMNLKKHPEASLIVFFVVLFITWGCSDITNSPPTAINMNPPTETISIDSISTADFMETASENYGVVTDQPTITLTTTPVPAGVFALLFYPSLVMNYDPSVWKDESQYIDRSVMVNYLQAKKLTTCTIGVQGPTDFNGPHSSETMLLGGINFSVLSFPTISTDFVSRAYLADQSLVGFDYASYGLPVFWISANPTEWHECQEYAKEVLSTLHFPLNK